MNDRQHARLIDLKDVCARMQQAWKIDALVDIRIVPSIKRGRFVGMATVWNDGRSGVRIEIRNRLTRERQIWILAHELRHIMQRQSGALRTVGGRDTWHGAAVDESAMPYNDLPWEKDANAWADQHASAFYGNEVRVSTGGRSLFDIPWGR